MREFSVHPKSQSDRAKYMFFAMLGSGLLIFFLSMLLQRFRGVVSFVGMIFIVGAVYIYTKYMGAEYYYDITVPDETPFFIIRHVIGKRSSTLCRVELSSILSVSKLNREQMKAHKTEEGVARYSYFPTMSPETVYLVKVRSSLEKADIFIEGTDEFAKVLMECAEEARFIIPEE